VIAQWPDGPGVVTFPDGRTIRGRGLRHPAPPGPPPQFGVYLLGKARPIGPWPHTIVPWPDFRLPRSTAEARAALDEAYDRAALERVEIACGGGVGRTGTGLAALAVRAGIPADDAVAWVRANYHRRAVETPWQRRWVRRLRDDGDSRSG
jgi:hypothetical protein